MQLVYKRMACMEDVVMMAYDDGVRGVDEFCGCDYVNV